MGLKILTSYFILIQLFGIMYAGFGMFSYIDKGEIIYSLLSFPFFALIYFWNIYGLSRALELDDPEKYKRIATLNPLNKTRLIGPVAIFSKEILTDWKNHAIKIVLTKWSLIYTFVSFAFTGIIFVMMAS